MSNTASFGLIALSLGLGYFLGMPIYDELSLLSAEKMEYAAAIESVNSLSTLQQTLKNKLDNLPAADRERIETLLPGKPDTTKLIADIDGIAAQNAISIDGVSFTSTNADAGRSVSQARPVGVYESGTLNMTFDASYSNLRNFLDDIESSLRLVDIRSIALNTAADKGVLTYKVTAEVYWLTSAASTTP